MAHDITSATDFVKSVLDCSKWGRLMTIMTKFCTTLENKLMELTELSSPITTDISSAAIRAIEAQLTVMCRDFCTLDSVFQMVDNCIYLFDGPRYPIHVENLTSTELKYLQILVMSTKTESVDNEFGYTQLYWSIPIKYQFSIEQRVSMALAGCSYILANARRFCATHQNKDSVQMYNFNLHICDGILLIIESNEFAKSLGVCGDAVIAGIRKLTLLEKKRIIRCIEEKLSNEFEFD